MSNILRIVSFVFIVAFLACESKAALFFHHVNPTKQQNVSFQKYGKKLQFLFLQFVTFLGSICQNQELFISTECGHEILQRRLDSLENYLSSFLVTLMSGFRSEIVQNM